MKAAFALVLAYLTLFILVGCSSTSPSAFHPTTAPPTTTATFAWQGTIAFEQFQSTSDNWLLDTYYLQPGANKKVSDYSYRYRPTKWSPNGQYFASYGVKSSDEAGDRPAKLLIYTRSGDLVQNFDIQKVCSNFSWTPDSSAIVGIDNYNICKFPIGGAKQELIAGGYYQNVVFSQDNVYAYYQSRSGDFGLTCNIRRIKITDLLAGNEKYEDVFQIAKTAYHEDILMEQLDSDTWLIGYSNDDNWPTLFIMGKLNTNTKQLTGSVTLPDEYIYQVAVSPDKKQIAYLCDGYIRLSDINFNSEKYDYPKRADQNNEYSFRGLCWSPDSTMLAINLGFADNINYTDSSYTYHGQVVISRISDGKIQTIYDQANVWRSARNAEFQPSCNDLQTALCWTY